MVNILTAGATRCLLGPKGGGFFEGGDAVGVDAHGRARIIATAARHEARGQQRGEHPLQGLASCDSGHRVFQWV